MRRNALETLSLVLLLGFSCRADLTIRYTTVVKTGAMPAMTDAIKAQMPAQLPKERVIRIKGDKTLSNAGLLTAVTDNARGEITLLDPAKKQYARIPLTDFAAAVQANMPIPNAAAQQAMKNFKVDVQNGKTGQMTMVFGIRAEEHLMTISMSMNMPGAADGPAPLAQVEVRTWLASPDDLTRIPGLREYAEYAQRALSLSNSADGIQKMLEQMPGMSEMMRSIAAGSTDNAGSLTVKTQERTYMSMPSAASKAPLMLMEMETDLAGISTDNIDDSVFDVPSDYREASSVELIKAMMPAPAAPASEASLAPRPPDLAPGEPVSRVGPGITPPAVIFKRDPEYTKEANAARLSGSVMLSLVVDKEGTPRNIRVVRPLGMGLDENAIEAVSHWKFRPGQKDGQPVNVRAQVEVNFKLLSDPLPR